MASWGDLQEPNQHYATLRAAIELLADVHGKRMSAEALAHWLKRLLPLAGSALYRALEIGCDERSFPSLGWVIETAANQNRRDTKPAPTLTPLTPVEQDASDRAAVKSLLWLHYAKGWTLDEIGKDSLGALYARQRGISPDDVPALVEAAMQAYPRETILRWMDDTAQQEARS